MMTRKEITSSLILILFGLGYLAYNTRHSLDTLNNPGSGVFPLIAGGALILLAVWHLIQTLRRPKKQDDQKHAPLNIQSFKVFLRERREAKSFILVAVFVVYLLMVTWVGFFTSNFIFVFISSRLMGARDWGRPLVLASGIDLFCYLLFEVWLNLSLPRGYLF